MEALDPTAVVATAEYSGACIGFFAIGPDPDAPKQMAVCRKTPDNKCPAFFDEKRCTLLHPKSAEVSIQF